MLIRCVGCMNEFADTQGICPHCGHVPGTPAESASSLEPGAVLHARYTVGKALEHSESGFTYIGWDNGIGAKVMIKEYLPTELCTRTNDRTGVSVISKDGANLFERGLTGFLREAESLAQYNGDPGIVNISECFKENGTGYAVCEYVEGETLGTKIAREGVLSEEETFDILSPVLVTLDKLHRAGILHLNITPGSILLCLDGQVKLTDFGAYRYVSYGKRHLSSSATNSGYSPEEQYRINAEQGCYTDVYSIAAVMYKMLTGKTPPNALDRRARFDLGNFDILLSPAKILKSVSPNTDYAISHAMRIMAEDRTQSIKEFTNDLVAGPTESAKAALSAAPSKSAKSAHKTGSISFDKIISGLKTLKKPTTATIVKIIVLILSLAVLISGIAMLLKPSKNGTPTEVEASTSSALAPDVTGLTLREAADALTNSGYTYTIVEEFSDTAEKNEIIAQSPSPGEPIEDGGSVVLTVCKGKAPKTVPDTVGMSSSDAYNTLTALGFSVTIAEVNDDTAAIGTVIDQSPQSSAIINDGESLNVTITVSKGKRIITVPDVRGMTESQASDAMIACGLTVTIKSDYSSIAEGCVAEQSLEPGTVIGDDDEKSVILTISKGKEAIKVPNIVGRSKRTAVNALEDIGMTVTIKEDYDPEVEEGRVISQSPKGGTVLDDPAGTKATITISKGQKTFTLKLDPNGGTISSTTFTVVDGKDNELPKPKYDYHTFEGWYTSQSDGDKISGKKGTLKSDMGTLYAHWSENQPSDWVVSSELPDFAKIADSKIQYCMRELVTVASYGDWSEWSEWTSDLIVEEPGYEYEYDTRSSSEYKYYRYICKSCGAVNPDDGTKYACYGCSRSGEGTMDYYSRSYSKSFDELGYSTTHGYKFVDIDGERWYCSDTDASGTEKRYRRREESGEKSWSEWSEFQDDPIFSSDTVEVRTREVVKYIAP